MAFLRELRILQLENCRLEFFEPQNMSTFLRVLSLRQNRIRELDRIIIGAANGQYDLDDVQLIFLDLSSNLFKEFPYKALKLQEKLQILNMSRNKIKSISQVASGNGGLTNNFEVFTKLQTLDLSSNYFSEFPLAVKDAPILKVLRLIHNDIKIIPTEFFKN